MKLIMKMIMVIVNYILLMEIYIVIQVNILIMYVNQICLLNHSYLHFSNLVLFNRTYMEVDQGIFIFIFLRKKSIKTSKSKLKTSNLYCLMLLNLHRIIIFYLFYNNIS